MLNEGTDSFFFFHFNSVPRMDLVPQVNSGWSFLEDIKAGCQSLGCEPQNKGLEGSGLV